MKFDLCKNVRVHFDGAKEVYDTNLGATLLISRTTVPVDIISSSPRDPEERRKCARLLHVLHEHADYNHYGGEEELMTIRLCLAVSKTRISAECRDLQGYVSLSDSTAGLDLLSGLGELSGERATFVVHLDFQRMRLESPSNEITTTEMRIGGGICRDGTLRFPMYRPSGGLIDWKSELFARVWITVTVPADMLAIYPRSLKFGRLGENGAMADVVIVCGNGTRIPARKCILALDSAVFRAMFQVDENRGKRGEETEVRMDMSEKVVRVYLNYIYCGDIPDLEDNVGEVLELFQAAQKYGIAGLQKITREKLGKIPNDKIDVDGAVAMFVSGGNCVPVDIMLQLKAVNILKTREFSKLKESPGYRKLFIQSQEVAMDLCARALTT